MGDLPSKIQTSRLLLRHWTESDVDELASAVGESIEELKPWMPWAMEEPQSREARIEMFGKWRDAWLDGKDSLFGMFQGNRVIGGTGLHRRGRPNELEIGYWVRSPETGQGFATEAARALTDAAFEIPATEVVSIHHDANNTASSAIPRRLGFRMVREERYEPVTSGCSGIEWQWEVTRAQWAEFTSPND